MRKLLLVTAIMMANVMTMSAAKKIVIDRIEPTDWYVGLKNPSVQLMVYGKGIRDVSDVTTDYRSVRIDSLVRLDSPNYLLIYMNVKNAQPGTMILNFKSQSSKFKVQSSKFFRTFAQNKAKSNDARRKDPFGRAHRGRAEDRLRPRDPSQHLRLGYDL